MPKSNQVNLHSIEMELKFKAKRLDKDSKHE